MATLGKDGVVLFQDEARVQYSPTITRMWALKGQKPEINTYGGRSRQHLIRAVDPGSGKVHVVFSKTLKAGQFQHFLEGLLFKYKDKGNWKNSSQV